MPKTPLSPRRQILASLAIGALASAGSIGTVRAIQGRCDPMAESSGDRRVSMARLVDDGDDAEADEEEARSR